jgi:hypothetical protein
MATLIGQDIGNKLETLKMNHNKITLWEWLLFLIFVSCMVLLFVGCQTDNQNKYTARSAKIKLIMPQQEPLAYTQYPEWAKKNWIHLVVFAEDNLSAQAKYRTPFWHKYYFVDADSFDNKSKCYTTIENTTICVGDKPYELDHKKFAIDYLKYWCFPCTQPGIWHSEPDGMGLSETGRCTIGISQKDILKCKHCGRYYLVGHIEFQIETGHVQWSRY